MPNDNGKNVWIPILKYGLPLVAVGGGLYIAYSYFVGNSRAKAAEDALINAYDTYLEKVKIFDTDGTITVEEQVELDREKDFVIKPMIDELAAAIRAADPIGEAIRLFTVAGVGLFLFKYGAVPTAKALSEWYGNQHATMPSSLTEHAMYELPHMCEALATPDPILATQIMTAAQTQFISVVAPAIQSQVLFLQAHLNQFAGIQLLYAQYMIAHAMNTVSFVSNTMFPYAFTLLPVI